MMKHARWLILGCLALCLLWSSWAGAQAPTTMAYQGRLLTAAGAPVATTTSVVFSIYAAASGGSAVWTETISVTPDANGVFAVTLGATSALNTTVFDGTVRYLGIRAGSDAEMTPRQALSSVPYALRSGAAAAPATIDGVANNGGNIDLVAGAGITITPNDAANTITMTGSGPLAYAVVQPTGVFSSSSGNLIVSWDTVNQWYVVSISGTSLSVLSNQIVISPLSSSAHFLTVDSSGGALRVKPYNHDGTVAQAWFGIMIYALPNAKSAPLQTPAGMSDIEYIESLR